MLVIIAVLAYGDTPRVGRVVGDKEPKALLAIFDCVLHLPKSCSIAFLHEFQLTLATQAL